MSETNTWPGKPGVPRDPEKDGWHWVNGRPREWLVCDDGPFWIFEECELRPYELAHCTYEGPCLTPDQATALQARVAELEEMLFGLLETFEGVGFRIGKTYPPRTASYEEAEQHYAKNYQGETALFMYQQWCQWRLVGMARAALEGKKE